MSTLNATSTAQYEDDYTTSDFRTEEQWLGEATEYRGKKRELIRLAYVNKFDFAKSQRKLAKMLGCSQSTVSEHVDNLLATGELTEEHYQKKMCYSRKPKQTDRKPIKPVENSTQQTPINSQSTNDSVSNGLQPFNTVGCNGGGIPPIQPEVVVEDEERGARITSMGTKQDRERSEDWVAIQYHLESLRELHRRNFLPSKTGFNESDWRELSQEYEALKYFADIRWEELRSDLQQCGEELMRNVNKAITDSEQGIS